MKKIKYILLLMCSIMALNSFSQTQSADPNAIVTDWTTVSLGKLQKKPRFKEPMIAVRFMLENGTQYLHLGLKYMFTDAVFEEAVPVEYYKDERIQFETNKGKFELNASKYAKARRMNVIAQKTADIKVLFQGDMSFLKDKLVKEFIVHFAQGYQDIKLNSEEAVHLQTAYEKFIAMLPKVSTSTTATSQSKIEPAVEKIIETPTVEQTEEDRQTSLERLRKQAKKWK